MSTDNVAISKVAAINMLPATRSQQKLVGEITSDQKGLSIAQSGFSFTMTVQGVAGKTIANKGIDIIACRPGDKGEIDPSSLNIQIGDGVIYTGAAGQPDEGITISVESLSEISVSDFKRLLQSGAMRLTEGIVRTSGDKSELQVVAPFYYTGLDFRGFDQDKLNNGVVKGQALSQDNVLGPFPFPEDTVVGGFGVGLAYKLLGLTGAVNRTVTIELYYDNFTSLPMLLKNLLLGDRAKKMGL